MKTDMQLKDDILSELDWDHAVKPNEIGVAVKDGVVTLTGHLSSYAQKYAAERAAQRVDGVKAIAVEMSVHILPDDARTDSDIALAAERALIWNVLVPDDKIRVSVEKGWITLTGEVAWDYQRRAAGHAVRNLQGVVGIINLIDIKSRASSSVIAKDIHDALTRQAHRAAKKVEISVQGSQVTLRGTVHSLAERAAIDAAAWSAPGVTAVVNNLVVGF